MTKKIAINHHIASPIMTSIVFSACYLTNVGKFEPFSYFRGLYSSISFGLIFSILTLLLPKKFAWVPNIFLMVFLVFNVTHIIVNGSHLNIEFSHFVFNSSFFESLFNSSYLETVLYFFTVWLSALWISRLVSFDVKIKFWLPLAFFTFFLDFLIPIDLSSGNWPQQNFLVNNINNLRTTSLLSDDNVSKENDFLVQDILAKKFLPNLVNKTPNIVVLVLEGFSQAYVEMGLAPELKKIQEEGVTVRNFVSNQLQTNRGLYALFCGDYPNIVAFETKSDFLASNLIQRNCLPHALKGLGYENYFLQSAFLSFMRKDLFAKNTGFDFAVGADSFKQEQIISSWGIPDNLLIESVYKVLVEEDNTNKPKFISALTSGTHHPYVTPVSSGDLPTAIQFTDMAVGKFYEALKKGNLLENTILIITSDEAKTISPKFPDIYSNWGILTMVGAGLKKQTVKEIFSQVDFSNSVLDFLGKVESFDLAGRSIFRRYETPHSIFMGNTYSKRIYMTIGEKSYLLCDYFLNCAVKTGEKDLFSNQYIKRSATDLEINRLKEFVNQNDLTFSRINRPILFQELSITVPKGDSHGVIEEFKTTSTVNKNLKYQIEKKGADPVVIEYSYYKCGDPSTIQRASKIVEDESDSILINVSESLLKENLCHTFYILNKADNDILIKRIVLSQ